MSKFKDGITKTKKGKKSRHNFLDTLRSKWFDFRQQIFNTMIMMLKLNIKHFGDETESKINSQDINRPLLSGFISEK